MNSKRTIEVRFDSQKSEEVASWRPIAVFVLGLALFVGAPIILSVWISSSLSLGWAIDLNLGWYALAVPAFPLLRAMLEKPARWRTALLVPTSWLVFDLTWDLSRGLCESFEPLAAATAGLWRWMLDHDVNRIVIRMIDRLLSVLPVFLLATAVLTIGPELAGSSRERKATRAWTAIALFFLVLAWFRLEWYVRIWEMGPVVLLAIAGATIVAKWAGSRWRARWPGVPPSDEAAALP